MNFLLNDLPYRTEKPRKNGITMVIDKGLSVREIEDVLSVSSDCIDIVKFGWGTSVVVQNLKEKINAYKQANIPVYFGGTLFEAFVARNQFDDYQKVLDKYGLEYAEVSNGSLVIAPDRKCEYIHTLSQQVKVLSEVGCKNAKKIISNEDWIKFIKQELEAGAWKVINEAREGGNVGIFDSEGQAKISLINNIIATFPKEKIIWETPLKSQQVFFVKLLGSNVNLGNISYNDIISLETIRLGLRGDTFNDKLK